MQLMPSTAEWLGVRDRCNLNENVSGGVLHLAWLMRRFRRDLRLVAAGYIAGEDVVTRRGLAYRNPETVAYVSRIRASCQGRVADGRRVNPARARSRVIR
jgi:soluble lytic murein transglycosylase-like protein